MKPFDADESGLVGKLLASLSDCRVLCVGDIMLDKYVRCEEGRMSPEAPVIAFAESSKWTRPGGVGNVAINVAALGCETLCLALTGDDAENAILGANLRDHGVEFSFYNRNPERPTTLKTRYVAAGQQLLRIDRETTSPADNNAIDELLSLVQGRAFDVIIVSDYGKGLVTPYLMNVCRALAHDSNARLIVDPKGTDWTKYGQVDLIKPNTAELEAATGLSCRTDAQVEVALTSALQSSSAKAILVTRGSEGASLMGRGHPIATHCPTSKVAVSDVCGAGDTNIAALGSLMAAGAELELASRFAQVASSLAVQRQGNAVISRREMEDTLALNKAPRPSQRKIIGGAEMAGLAQEWRAKGLRVGFTNGCFDILHSGHISMLETCRAHCDKLIVGMNSDASIKRLKGASRPIVTQEHRAGVLAGLYMVDAVVTFSEDTPENLIRAIRPDVLVKGGDYTPDQIVGGNFVEANGGEVIIANFVEGQSTSRIVDGMKRTPSSDVRRPKASKSFIESAT